MTNQMKSGWENIIKLFSAPSTIEREVFGAPSTGGGEYGGVGELANLVCQWGKYYFKIKYLRYNWLVITKLSSKQKNGEKNKLLWFQQYNACDLKTYCHFVRDHTLKNYCVVSFLSNQERTFQNLFHMRCPYELIACPSLWCFYANTYKLIYFNAIYIIFCLYL